MITSQNGIDFIKRWEGYSGTVYLCGAGVATIGYGHAIKAGEVFTEPLTPEQAESVLRRDVGFAENAVYTKVEVELTQNQFDALVSLIFNIGVSAFTRSTLRQKLNRQDYQGAAQEFTKWVYAGCKRLKGLELRRKAEKELFLLPDNL